MSKSPLQMECWHCREYAGHRVIKTDPQHYHWSDETIILFERIAGRDISLRQRTKHCDDCGNDFVTLEMSHGYLSAMINEIKRLEQKDRESEREKRQLRQLYLLTIKQYKEKINELENQVQALTEKLASIVEIATPTND